MVSILVRLIFKLNFERSSVKLELWFITNLYLNFNFEQLWNHCQELSDLPGVTYRLDEFAQTLNALHIHQE